MIPVCALVDVFRGIIGWPYASPGSNNDKGIDCSGAFVYAYQQFGKKIYHGSNRIIREYCYDVKTITSVNQLQVGMAIFKSRTDLSRLKAEYKPGGQYYRADLPYDYYHMGLVASVRPLEIINATPPKARIDSDLSKWCCAGYLDAVDYAQAESCGEPESTAVVVASSGSTVNLRSSPSKSAVVLFRVPVGETVRVLEKTNDQWWKVEYQKIFGYMMSKFLRET
ncbi:MAG: SH3 domain-containing protein [Eubacteriales bacterium]|nr:SH3 domain-containing protein [Eubacteriales bacterium]